MDLTEYKDIIEIHQQKMESHIEGLRRFQNYFGKKINHAKIYPNWAVVVFIVNLVLGIGGVVSVVMYYSGM
ncbi:hypothetical protein JEM65_20525 [Gelidibacter salicanalis]|uniref:Uncharacterized protein n=2 Tax=Gelidibacter salicanalis TaxID=291193 RepID=A0A934KSI9_9FLAO|nr:hypothetical protein [Gelidibacter salicanalis]